MAVRKTWTGTGVTITVGSLAALATAVTTTANPGDTILISNGTYDWQVYAATITLAKSGVRIKGESARGVIFKGLTTAPTAVDNQVGTRRLYGLKLANADNCWVEDIDFYYFGVGLDVDNSNDVVVQGCWFESNFDVGLSFFDSTRPTCHMNVFRDPFLSADINQTIDDLVTSPLPAGAQQDYGVYIYGARDSVVTHNYFMGHHNQACSFKEGNVGGYVAYNTWDGAMLTALFFGQNKASNGPYEHSGLPTNIDTGTWVCEYNVFRPAQSAGKTYKMNTCIRAWHASGDYTFRFNVIEAAVVGILIEGRDGSEAGYFDGIARLSFNTIGGAWKNRAGTLLDVATAGIRLYMGITATVDLDHNAFVYHYDAVDTLQRCADTGEQASRQAICPVVHESQTLNILPTTITDDLTLRTGAVTYDPDFWYYKAPAVRSRPRERPHFGHPFKVGNTVEQDTTEHVDAQAHVVVLCPLGFREDRPEFGWPWPEFANAPIDTGALQEALHRFVGRDVDAREYADAADAAVRHISVDVEG